MPENDLNLFIRISQGNQAAFNELFDKYYMLVKDFLVRATGNKYASEDLTLNVFCKIWDKRKMLTEIQAPYNWIMRIAHNAAHNYMRNEVRKNRRNGLFAEKTILQHDEVNNSVLTNDLKSLVYEAVAKLTPRQKEIYLLYFEEQLSRKEISSRLSLSENTVKNHLQAARDFIQQYIIDNAGIYIPLCLVIHRTMLTEGLPGGPFIL